MNDPQPANEPLGHLPALLAAMRRLLRPLVRLAMRGGITFPALSDMLKELCIEVPPSRRGATAGGRRPTAG